MPVNLDEAHDLICTNWSDIRAHIPALEQAASEATSIIELGVRSGVSTIAFLYAMREQVTPDMVGARGTVYSVDVDWPTGPFTGLLSEIAAERALGAWEFIHGDDLSPPVLDRLPDEADVVFIDTTHGYEQTLNELMIYKPLVNDGGRILLHDVMLEHPVTAPGDDPRFPVKQAVEKFCGAFQLYYEINSEEDEQYAQWTNGCLNGLATVYV